MTNNDTRDYATNIDTLTAELEHAQAHEGWHAFEGTRRVGEVATHDELVEAAKIMVALQNVIGLECEYAWLVDGEIHALMVGE